VSFWVSGGCCGSVMGPDGWVLRVEEGGERCVDVGKAVVLIL